MTSENINIDNALRIITAKLCGEGLAYVLADGMAKVVAIKDGVFVCLEQRVKKFNNLSTAVILNTIIPYNVVKKGDVVANIEIVDFNISIDDVEKLILAISGNVELLSVAKVSKAKVALVYTSFFNDSEEKEHIARIVKKLISNFSSFELNFDKEYMTNHNEEDIANTISLACKEGSDYVFVLPAINDRNVLAKIFSQTCDLVICKHFPQIGISDLVIASKKKQRIMAIPYHYVEMDTRAVDSLIKKAIVNEILIADDFNNQIADPIPGGEVLSSEEELNLMAPIKDSKSANKGNIAGVILAAGASLRAGKNKLLVDIDGEPLFLKSIKAAIESKISPIFVVIGHRADEMQEILQSFDVNILVNSNYRSGVKTSINLAIKSIPSFCKGAIIIPADMPNICVEHLENMLKSFDIKKEKQLHITTYKGLKCNPVLWSKGLFDVADIVPENSNLRTVFLEHVDYTKEFEVKSETEILDVTFPSDIEKL